MQPYFLLHYFPNNLKLCGIKYYHYRLHLIQPKTLHKVIAFTTSRLLICYYNFLDLKKWPNVPTSWVLHINHMVGWIQTSHRKVPSTVTKGATRKGFCMKVLCLGYHSYDSPDSQVHIQLCFTHSTGFDHCIGKLKKF